MVTSLIAIGLTGTALGATLTKNAHARAFDAELLIVFSARHNFYGLFAVDGLNFTAAAYDGLSHRYFLLSVDIEAFSLELRVLLNAHFNDQVAKLAIQRLVALLFNPQQHPIIDTLRYLDKKVRALTNQSVTLAVVAVHGGEASAKAFGAHFSDIVHVFAGAVAFGAYGVIIQLQHSYTLALMALDGSHILQRLQAADDRRSKIERQIVELIRALRPAVLLTSGGTHFAKLRLLLPEYLLVERKELLVLLEDLVVRPVARFLLGIARSASREDGAEDVGQATVLVRVDVGAVLLVRVHSVLVVDLSLLWIPERLVSFRDLLILLLRVLGLVHVWMPLLGQIEETLFNLCLCGCLGHLKDIVKLISVVIAPIPHREEHSSLG